MTQVTHSHQVIIDPDMQGLIDKIQDLCQEAGLDLAYHFDQGTTDSGDPWYSLILADDYASYKVLATSDDSEGYRIWTYQLWHQSEGDQEPQFLYNCPSFLSAVRIMICLETEAA